MKSVSRTWFVTGASKGVGRKLVTHLLEQGHRVAATSRAAASLTDVFGRASDRFLPLEVDLTNDRSVQDAIEKTVQRFGGVDVVVNNAGYAQQGTVEALSDEELRRNFEVNFFAPMTVMRHALPHLRRQRSGHIINISSIVGYHGGYAGWGSYVASKFALSGVTESLAAEVAELGIRATVVYPGPVRTEFLSSDALAVAKRQIDDYSEAKASLDLHLGTLHGRQAGDPDKLALLIIQAANVESAPLHLFAGKIANELAAAKASAVEKDLHAWKGSSEATDFAD
ncbi:MULTISPECIES: SDR family oxidoreductase [Ralstonia]|uniref:3-phenylpropionate-dihydrodiol/cinnamic acid-dihydrodiol dehydrogenase n=1 Tax=Ralstonia mannitolilytica TaxID=105219 RepID=A0AAD2EFK8_9RALS|nr:MULTISPECIES: SDR family oxidoreductase [Ralstonia]MBY4718949.1 SDR family oxidoreductase [Ralstonia mannitolilytica]CAJ0680041.1 3-phenylpropionate-dihydrodiol/cinnamic acid-dihydrodiol dehydrogenase [Ralstonia mannitolilytica]CAJ0713129.1 3-phenylpropionate-dihydrodiol/cinnamic acid-dihydrodiol dehydrogenase [Ralstonia sp. LMG 6871]CAJ0856414.1 3-phenylpropionate-dihydrodiol/cinnamic acid-dihydrodiol dehydrogenase [Ralstonia mannitolilytica]